jgi:hypothetical protein
MREYLALVGFRDEHTLLSAADAVALGMRGRSRRTRSINAFTTASWSRKSPSSLMGTRNLPSTTRDGTDGSFTLRDWSSARLAWSWTLKER